jgi:hypothetical protein
LHPGYQPIELDPRMPGSIESLVRERIEPNLRDVRKMLESSGGMEPAFNFSIAAVLCSIIGGLSRVFYCIKTWDSDAFPAAASHYQLKDEPAEAIRDSKQFGRDLYHVYRCNLVHSLGLAVDKSPDKTRWQIITLPSVTKVTRHEPLPLSPQQLRELEDTQRPKWLKPTLSAVDGVVRLNADALYWGVRVLVKTLAEDVTLRAGAESFLAPWYQPRIDLAPSQAVMSSAPVTMQTIGREALHSTVGAATGVGSGHLGEANDSGQQSREE